MEATALAGAEPATQLIVIIKSTGPAWLPIAVCFGRRGHAVLRVTSAKAADLRRFLARHTKSNGIDAETLARVSLVAASGLTAVSSAARCGRRWTVGCGRCNVSPPKSAGARPASARWPKR